jgi:kynurenine formamidase
MKRSILFPLAAAVLLLACGPDDDDDIAELFSNDAAWTDLSYSFNEHTIYWPTAERFEREVVSAGMTEGGYYYAANNLRGAEHGGTHLDAPIHFYEGGHSTEQIPLGRFIGPALVVDVAAKAEADADYLLTVADLEEFEAAHGRIPDGAILLLRSGWEHRWPDAEAVLGTALRGAEATSQLHFPGVDPAAARWLVEQRSIDALGIDTPSIDHGPSTTFETHQILFAANIPAFENVAHLDRLPQTGAYVVALPMKIEGGSGGPLRIVAVVP